MVTWLIKRDRGTEERGTKGEREREREKERERENGEGRRERLHSLINFIPAAQSVVGVSAAVSPCFGT